MALTTEDCNDVEAVLGYSLLVNFKPVRFAEPVRDKRADLSLPAAVLDFGVNAWNPNQTLEKLDSRVRGVSRSMLSHSRIFCVKALLYRLFAFAT